MTLLKKVTPLALAFLLAPAAAWACDGHGEQNAQKAQIKKVTVADVATMSQAKTATAVDANSQKTREKYGVIPGAILLTSSSGYEPAKELPADKNAKLVFYCANTKCSASEKAARRALEAGYTDISVLPDGIMGWKEAGKNTAVPQS